VYKNPDQLLGVSERKTNKGRKNEDDSEEESKLISHDIENGLITFG
jgi:hypothetical protein